MPRPVFHTAYLDITDPRVDIQMSSGVMTVAGPRGSLTRDFRNLAIDVQWHQDTRKVAARYWSGKHEPIAQCKTLFGQIKAMVTGVTKGYRYKMCFPPLPITAKHTISESSNELIFTTFAHIVQKKRIVAPLGVRITSNTHPEEIWVEGNDKDAVTLTCAKIRRLSKNDTTCFRSKSH